MTGLSNERARERAAVALAAVGIVLTGADRERIEVADMGLARLDRIGLEIFTYVNTERYCAKELVLLPGQVCPEHRHPPFEGTPGKEETFRCRAGLVYLYVEGAPTLSPAVPPPDEFFTVRHELVLRPGEQHTIPPNTLHWFAPGSDGAVISEFSSQSRDDLDVFTNPKICRVGKAPQRTLP